jgi:hypothetical protein
MVEQAIEGSRALKMAAPCAPAVLAALVLRLGLIELWGVRQRQERLAALMKSN